MISIFETWRRNLLLWAIPAGFCAVMLLVFAFYRFAYAGRVEGLERQYQAAVAQRDGLRAEREVVVTFLDKVDVHRGETQGLYSEYFQTEPQRFTRVIQEVKSLAEQAGLRPSSLSYPRTDFSSFELVQRNINFSVEGTYDQLRNFINFLELTDQFVVLNSVTLGGSGSDRGNPALGINLVLSTIFATRDFEDEVEEPTT
ncbi:MAG: hypothetical protein AAF560_10530 [Acidobacteriota bacterium]